MNIEIILQWAPLIGTIATTGIALLLLFQFRELKKTNMLAYWPDLVPRRGPPANNYKIQIQNIGNSSARRIYLEIKNKQSGQSAELDIFALIPGEPTLTQPELLANPGDIIILDGKYETVAGDIIPVKNQEFKISDFKPKSEGFMVGDK